MANERKEKRSILLFYDFLEMIDSMSTNDAGFIFKHLIMYEFEKFNNDFLEDRIIEHKRNLLPVYRMGKYQLDRGKEIFYKKFGDE